MLEETSRLKAENDDSDEDFDEINGNCFVRQYPFLRKKA